MSTTTSVTSCTVELPLLRKIMWLPWGSNNFWGHCPISAVRLWYSPLCYLCLGCQNSTFSFCNWHVLLAGNVNFNSKARQDHSVYPKHREIKNNEAQINLILEKEVKRKVEVWQIKRHRDTMLIFLKVTQTHYQLLKVPPKRLLTFPWINGKVGTYGGSPKIRTLKTLGAQRK